MRSEGDILSYCMRIPCQKMLCEIIAKLEGPAVSQYCALRLFQATLDESLYELARELVRFLLRSGRDSEQHLQNLTDYLLDSWAISFFILRADVAPVKNILENHTSYLISGKELSKLVAFVNGAQFDLVEYLQRERFGSARLENFASTLEQLAQKVLFYLFRHDMQLWKAYGMTLKSHPSFAEYLDLLEVFEEKFSSLANSEDKQGRYQVLETIFFFW
ncbi:hypothetical protein DITRI_Ditri13aG0040800 [Diplodiscus trichospermus]